MALGPDADDMGGAKEKATGIPMWAPPGLRATCEGPLDNSVETVLPAEPAVWQVTSQIQRSWPGVAGLGGHRSGHGRGDHVQRFADSSGARQAYPQVLTSTPGNLRPRQPDRPGCLRLR